jgi:hypothetical protein
MAVVEFDPKRRVGQQFLHNTGEFEDIFLGHGLSNRGFAQVGDPNAGMARRMRRNFGIFKGKSF